MRFILFLLVLGFVAQQGGATRLPDFSTKNTIAFVAPSIETGTIPAGPHCPGSTLTVPYTVVGGQFDAGNQFTAQISDANGGFSAPIDIGTRLATGPGSISATLPTNLPAGTGYRIRVVANGPTTIGTDNGNNITISQAYTFYADADGDDYFPSGATSTIACSEPINHAPANKSGDCNDALAAVNPAAQEVCDNLDNDCDGLTDLADASNVDITAPTARCRRASVLLGSGGTATLDARFVNANSSDNCSAATALALSVSPATLSCAGGDVQSITLTVTDEAGRTASCSAQVSVLAEVAYNHDAALEAPGAYTGDCTGSSLALFDDMLVVGAPLDRVGTNFAQGSVSLYAVASDYSTSFLRKITATDGAWGDLFGNAVALDGSALLVGAPKNTINLSPEQGAAYLYYRHQNGANAWGEVKQLTAADGIMGDRFGSATSVKANIAVVGAPLAAIGTYSGQGAAYVFEKDFGGSENWGMAKKLTATDGTPDTRFGVSVAQWSDWAAVAANCDRQNRGAVYLFRQNIGGASNWGQAKKLMAPDSKQGDTFGTSLSMSGDYVLAGAPNHNQNRGAGYLFKKGAGGNDDWSQVAKLTVPAAQIGLHLGTSAVLVGDFAYLGTHREAGRAGAVYVFHRNEGGADNWGYVGKLVAPDGRIGDQFGAALAADAGAIFVGANFDEVAGQRMQGAVHQFIAPTCSSPRPSETGNRSEGALAATETAAELRVQCRTDAAQEQVLVEIAAPEAARVQVFSAAGHLLAEADLPEGNAIWNWDASAASAGLYALRVTAGAHWRAVPFVLAR